MKKKAKRKKVRLLHLSKRRPLTLIALISIIVIAGLLIQFARPLSLQPPQSAAERLPDYVNEAEGWNVLTRSTTEQVNLSDEEKTMFAFVVKDKFEISSLDELAATGIKSIAVAYQPGTRGIYIVQYTDNSSANEGAVQMTGGLQKSMIEKNTTPNTSIRYLDDAQVLILENADFNQALFIWVENDYLFYVYVAQTPNLAETGWEIIKDIK